MSNMLGRRLQYGPQAPREVLRAREKRVVAKQIEQERHEQQPIR